MVQNRYAKINSTKNPQNPKNVVYKNSVKVRYSVCECNIYYREG